MIEHSNDQPLTIPHNIQLDPSDNKGHRLLEKGNFEQLQRNEIVETRPQILHFGGFKLHKEHAQPLRILNISKSSLRLAIIGPSTPFFKIRYEKKGLLAPGMSEEVTVNFTPYEWRYYHDTIKIFLGESGESLVVPIHAYPSANDIRLPRVVDFGRVALGTSRTKVIPLSCKIPIQFEFEITVVQAHPDFEVTPQAGQIPADGTTNVAITFLPTKHHTAHMELRVNISQFDWEPVTVAVVGSCTPDASRNEVYETRAAETEARREEHRQAELVQKVERLKKTRARPPLELKPPKFIQEPDRIIDGVKIPINDSMTATNFVLNQTAGKLPLKDLFAFIKEQREAAEARRRKAEQKTGDEQEEDEEDQAGEEEDRQAQELRFEMQYREVEKYDKDKELKGMVAIGDDALTEAEQERVRQGRRKRFDRLLNSSLEADASRVESKLTQDRVVVPLDFKFGAEKKSAWDEYANDTFSMRLQVIDRFVRAGSKCLVRVRARQRLALLREAMRAAGVTDRAACKAWVDAENKAAAAGGRAGGEDGAKKKKKATIAPSGEAAGQDASGAEDDAAEAEPEQPEKDDEKALLGSTVGVTRLPLDFVLPNQIPTMQSSMGKTVRQEVEVTPLSVFRVFETAKISVRLDFKVLNYEHIPYDTLAPPASYMRPYEKQKRGPYAAALEELSIRGPRGDILDGAEQPFPMPAACLLPPLHEPISLIVPSTKCRSYVALPDFVETDYEYRLGSEPPPLRQPLQAAPLSIENIDTVENPWMRTYRQKRQIDDPFRHFDPCPTFAVEAGGPQGPLVAGDFVGERLRFMPAGGLARDCPSDTDSDGRDEELFEREVAAPKWEEFMKDYSTHDPWPVPKQESEIVSERWSKELYVDTTLREKYAERSRAVRDRLTEFNEHLLEGNSWTRLYLG